MKRRFLIRTGQRGGDLLVGRVSRNFVEYWGTRAEDQLIRHIETAEYGEGDGFDADSPDMTADGNRYWAEVSDIVRITAPYEDAVLSVVEVIPDENEGADPEEIGEAMEFTLGPAVFDRELYTSPAEEAQDNWWPVLMVHASGKGTFSQILIETDGPDFEPDQLRTGNIETDLCRLAERFWYRGTEVQPIIVNDVIGTSFSAMVGYINPDFVDVISDDDIREALAAGG